VPPTPNEPLPPELNPRGRRAGRRELAAQQAPVSTPPATRAATSTSLRGGLALGTKIIAVLLSVTILAGSGWIWATWTGFTSDLQHVDAIGSATPGATPEKDIDGKAQNILITGNDDRSTATAAELKLLGTTADGGSLNTDTMMVMHVPANGSKATVFSFPRDSYVAIPGHGSSKLNSAYPDGYSSASGSTAAKRSAGAALLVQTIQNLTGLTIDHYVQVDLIGFYRISNAIGGIPVNLCAAQKESNSGINLPAGVSTIEGTQALAFVRQRYGLPNGDLDRIKRQQYFLSAVFRKMTSSGVLLNPFKLNSLLKAVSNSIVTDAKLDPLALANQLQSLTAGNLSFSTIPTDGFANNDAGSVVVVHPGDVQKFVSTVVGLTNSTSATAKPSTSAAAKTVAPGSFTVDVLNGAGTSGTAARNASALTALGFKVGTVGNSAVTTATVIQYPDGQQAQAATLAAKVSGATVQASSSVTRVTLVLGSDGHSVSGAASTSTSSPSTTSTSSTSAIPTGVTNAADSGKCIN
jgi:LCP family protein required for cell wall assembly